MVLNLDALVVNIIVSTIVLSPVLWLAGRVVVGGEKARFVDAVLIAVIGTVIGGVLGAFTTGIIVAIIQLIIWLGLVRYYFECSWGKAIVISFLSIIVFIVIGAVLALVGFTLFTVFI